MDHLTQMLVFTALIETGSFTAAADQLGVAKSTVSRRIRELEDRLGVRLVSRTTRVTRPTDIGLAYYERCKRIIEDAAEADRAVMDEHADPRGLLRITAAPLFANRYLASPVASLLEQHPGLRVELILEERLVNIVEEGIDVAIRIARPRTSELVSRRLGISRMVMCAAPSYLERHGAPETLDDIGAHHCIIRTGDAWLVRDAEDNPRTLQINARFSADQGGALLEAAVAGTGLAYLPDFVVRDAFEAGALVSVLPEMRSFERPVYALFLQRRLLSPRVRMLIDHLAAYYQTPPWQIEN